MIIAAGGHEQALVQFYAVSVFAGFLAATLACARLSHRDGRYGPMATSLLGAALVALVLVLNLTQAASVGYPGSRAGRRRRCRPGETALRRLRRPR